MKTLPVAQTPPERPVMIYDGRCGFCRMWVARWKQRTREAVEYIASQEPAVAERFPELPEEMFRRSVVLVEPDRRVSTAAQAVFRSLAVGTGRLGARTVLFLYERAPGAAWISDRAYFLVARHRNIFSRITRLLWGESVELPSHVFTRWLFLRGLGLIYLAAFVSLWVQISGLVGSGGILPAAEFLENVRAGAGARGYFLAPTLFWLTGASDGALHLFCAGGVMLATLLVAGVATAPVLLALWLLYLSLCVVCQDFLQFQWDALLLESGLLAVFFAPLQLLPRLSREREPSHLILWLLRWLAFRFMLMSGAVKLMSGDVTWRDLSALTYHYETQPLPTWIGWFAHQAPRNVHLFSTTAMYVTEIVLALFIFLPRRPRIFAAAAFVVLQVLILLTGNYGYFNWLTILLCIPLLDDFVWPKRWRERWLAQPPLMDSFRSLAWPGWIIGPVAAVVFVLTCAKVSLQVRLLDRTPTPLMTVLAFSEAFRSWNSYGLFAVMTTQRPEIIIEGSRDGIEWRPYEFQHKPGPLDRRPGFVTPHMPRLDWQMWFAALGDVRQNAWFLSFGKRLLEGAPPVTGLLRTNPFPDEPPRYLRARMFLYQFTDWKELRSSGRWWEREELGPYVPVLALENGELVAVRSFR